MIIIPYFTIISTTNLNSNSIALANVSKFTWSFRAPACFTCPNNVMPIIA